jgi:radical SAM protein with 4Fe4S-binding SPASM domain
MEKPFSIFNIELTNHCLMKCVMCPRTNNMTRGLGYMDLDIFKKAINEMSACNPEARDTETLWLHHFGESLMHPRFGTCIAYASDHSFRTGLSINPIMLNDDVIDELLQSTINVLYISLDGHDDESFSRIRGIRNAYTASKERLKRFLKKKSDHGFNTTVILSMVDFNLNRESIELSRNYWESMPGVDQFLTKSFTTWDGGAPDVNSFSDPGEDYPVDRTTVQCSWPFERMSITWDGDVVPCCFDYDKKYVLGNIGSVTLTDIWNGEPMRLLRNEFIQNNVANPLCVNCRRLYLPKHLVKL